MINKQLNDITWADLELLKEIGREEDDRIEYKEAFSGGADYLALGDKQRLEANAAIAKEVVAFLNGRGGDVLIGVKEASKSHPRIEEFLLVHEADDVASRLAASLAALIEPAQSLVNLKVVKPHPDSSSGVIVVRAPQSLRAPHRVMKDKECYIRRGSSSFRMGMDEIQEKTLSRSKMIDEKFGILNSYLNKIGGHRVGRRNLPQARTHVRIGFVCEGYNQLDLGIKMKSLMDISDASYLRDGKRLANFFAIDGFSETWQPTVRGERSERYRPGHADDWSFWCKEIYQYGLVGFDFACSWNQEARNSFEPVFYQEWLEEFFAYSLYCIREISKISVDFLPFLTGFSFYNHPRGDLSIDLGLGAPKSFQFEDEMMVFPNHNVSDIASIDELFSTFMADILSLAGRRIQHQYQLADAQ